MGRDPLKTTALEREVKELRERVKRLDALVEDYWRAQFTGYPGFD
jgi:hypothetical protein